MDKEPTLADIYHMIVEIRDEVQAMRAEAGKQMYEFERRTVDRWELSRRRERACPECRNPAVKEPDSMDFVCSTCGWWAQSEAISGL